MITEYFTKHSLARAAGLDPRCKAIKALPPVAYLHYTVGSKIPLYSFEQLTEIAIK
ncbi:MAG TPA: hypothetical protein VN857_04965 [Chthoniobacterales bacterium]|nr:hypothetical protein [Chthoniobacterales bacterium]